MIDFYKIHKTEIAILKIPKNWTQNNYCHNISFKLFARLIHQISVQWIVEVEDLQ